MHLIDEETILDLLSQTLMNPIKNNHIVLIYRRDPFLPLPAMRFRRAVNEIRTKDLKFTTQYVKAFLENALEQDIDLETAENWKDSLADQNDHQAKTLDSAEAVNWRDILTNREYDVLQLLKQRLRDKEIADKLYLSTETIKTHLKHLYRKLGATDRRDAIVKAKQLGLLR